MKVFITGHEGRIGSKLVEWGYNPLICDITDPEAVENTLRATSPDVLIHCAAITDVEYCQRYPVFAYKVNARGTANLINNFDGVFIFLSTDHVFSGKRSFIKKLFPWGGYSEDVIPSPMNVYGMSKYSAEELSLCRVGQTVILRLSKVFDNDDVSEVLYDWHSANSIEYTDLIYRSWLHVKGLTAAIVNIVDNLDKMPQKLNVAGEDILSHYEFWMMVRDKLRYGNRIVPRRHKVYDYAPRPFYGGLDVSKAQSLGVPTYSIKESISWI